MIFCFTALSFTADALAVQEPGSAESATAETSTESSTASSSEGGGLPWPVYVIPVLGLVGLGFTFWKSSWVASQEVDTERME